MHVATRKAILTQIDVMSSQLQILRSLLVSATQDEHRQEARVDKTLPDERQYTTDDEDDLLEKMIEESRKEALEDPIAEALNATKSE